MARNVKVNLLLEAARFIRGARDAGKAADELADGLDDVARSGDDTTKATEELGGGLDDLATHARKLDRQIADTKSGMRDLARQIAATADEAERAELSKKLNVEQRSLRKQTKIRDLIDVDSSADEAARGFAVRFGARVGPLMASMPFEGAAAAGTVLGVAMAPAIGAALAGAVIGGAAGTGIIGGAVLAARDARVKAAGADLGAFILGDLEKRSAAFVPVMLDSIGRVRSAWSDMGSDISRIFGSSRLVDPLVDGAISGARKAVAGFADLVGEAEPVTAALGNTFDHLGDVMGDTLSTLAQDADEGASAINELAVATGNLVRHVGGLVHLAATVKGYTDQLDVAIDKGRYWLEDNGHLSSALGVLGVRLDMTADGFAAGSVEAEAYRNATLGTATAADFAVLSAAGMTNAQIAAADASGTFRARTDEVNSSLATSQSSYALTGQTIEEFNAALAEMNTLQNQNVNENISAEQANLRLEEAIDKAAAAGKRNNDGISEGTAKGRANRQALLGIASAAQSSAEAIFEQTGSQEAASRATEKGRSAFLKSAAAMGVSKSEANKLADQLFGIPEKRKSTVTVETKQTPIDLKTLAGRIAAIKSKRVVVTVVNNEVTTRSEGRNVGIGDGIGGRRWGGIVEHAQWGRLREAQVASTMSPARYAWAEPATGGEAFIPRRGNADRSLAILSRAARWYGQQIVPAGAPAPTSVTAHLDEGALYRAVRRALSEQPVQRVRNTGREADLLLRGR